MADRIRVLSLWILVIYIQYLDHLNTASPQNPTSLAELKWLCTSTNIENNHVVNPTNMLRQWLPTFFNAFLPLLILELFTPSLFHKAGSVDKRVEASVYWWLLPHVLGWTTALVALASLVKPLVSHNTYFCLVISNRAPSLKITHKTENTIKHISGYQ